MAIIQARLGSTRLPGKVLLPICGRPMLEVVVERARRATTLDEVLVATTTDALDDPLVALCGRQGWRCVRGSQDDVLDRYLLAARASAARVVVRITSDCPLIDPGLIDDVVRALRDDRADYASNVLGRRTYPRGLDVEAMRRDALERAGREATLPHEREHVTPFLQDPSRGFRTFGVHGTEDHSAHRWTVDVPQDLELVRAVYAELGPAGPSSWLEVLELLERRPELVALNAAVRQKPTLPGGP